MTDQQVAFVAQGKLHRRSASGELRPVESAFGRSLRDRAAQIHNRHAWKTKGTSAQFLQGMSCAGGVCDPGEFRVSISGVCGGPEPGSLFYTLETDEVGGIFTIDAQGVETRLFHTADFRVRHIAISPGRDEVAASIVYPNYSSHIAIMRSEGAAFQEVTEGESMDLAPSWAAGSGRRIVFQSAGMGRDSSGRFTGLSANAIQLLDLDSGDLATAAEDAAHDLLSPRMTADGSLYYIRRPYEPGPPKASVLGALKDAALMPFRISYAFFQFFNFFSLRYTGKPLANSAGGLQRQQDLKQMMILGNLVDAAKAARASEDAEAPSMVPSTWQLVRRGPTGEPETLARSVLSYDVAADGSVLYSNGSAVYHLAGGSRPQRLLLSQFIEQVVALG